MLKDRLLNGFLNFAETTAEPNASPSKHWWIQRATRRPVKSASDDTPRATPIIIEWTAMPIPKKNLPTNQALVHLKYDNIYPYTLILL